MHNFFLVRHIVEDSQITHSNFPDGQFVFKGWSQIDETLASPRRQAGLISELFANSGENSRRWSKARSDSNSSTASSWTTISYAIATSYTGSRATSEIVRLR